MMKQMRENTKVVLWIVVFAFLVTIFAVWGLDLQTTGVQTQQGQGVLGRVNGVAITPQAYQAIYNQMAAQFRASNPDGGLSYSQQELLREQAWQSIVNNILTEEVIDQFGIGVTDQEIVAFLRTSPPPEIQQYFLDENGQFDFTAYSAALNNPEADWTAVEALARQRIPLIKLNQYLMSQVHVGTWEVRDAWEASNTRMVVDYVSFPIADEDIGVYTPTADETRSYYDNHPDEFVQGERAVLDYVRIPIAATDADREDVLLTLGNIRNDILAGDDFGDNARTFSDAFTASVEGETGFLSAGQRPAAVMDAVAVLEPGAVSDLIETDAGVYLVQLIEKKEEDGETRYNMREIMLEISAGSITIDSLITTAQEVQRVATETADLTGAAEASGLVVGTTLPFEANSPISDLGFVPSVSRFAFANDKGTVSNVLQDDRNYYIVRVSERLPEGTRAYEEVDARVYNQLIEQRRKDMALRKAEAFDRKIRTTRIELRDAAEQYAYSVSTTDTFTVQQPVNMMPPNSPFSIAALKLQDGAVSRPIESQGTYYVLQVRWRTPFDPAAFAAAASVTHDRLLQQKVNEFIAFWYGDLKENSDIEDNRGTL